MFYFRFSSSDYWFNQMYYGTHGPFKRAEGGQAITFENDKVCTKYTVLVLGRSWSLYDKVFSTIKFGGPNI